MSNDLQAHRIVCEVILVDLIVVGVVEPNSSLIVVIHNVAANGIIVAVEKRYTVLIVA